MVYNTNHTDTPSTVRAFNQPDLRTFDDGKPIALQKMCTNTAGQRDLVFIKMVATYMPKADV